MGDFLLDKSNWGQFSTTLPSFIQTIQWRKEWQREWHAIIEKGEYIESKYIAPKSFESGGTLATADGAVVDARTSYGASYEDALNQFGSLEAIGKEVDSEIARIYRVFALSALISIPIPLLIDVLAIWLIRRIWRNAKGDYSEGASGMNGRKWAAIICGCVGIGGLAMAIIGLPIAGAPAWVGIPVGLLWLIGAFFLTQRPKRCKSCHKWFCMAKGQNEFVGEEQISMSVEVKEKNRYGEVVGAKEQYIPGTRTHYRTPYICKHCQSVQYVGKSVDTQNV